MDDPRSFRFEYSRARWREQGAPLFAGHWLRLLAEQECEPFSIQWRDWPELAGDEHDVLVVGGSGPLRVVTMLYAYAAGHDLEPFRALEQLVAERAAS